MRRIPIVYGLAVATSLACASREPIQDSYFERSISPTLSTICARGPTGGGCHVASDRGYAFGNLDVSSYERLAKRRDLLVSYGPYGQPAFLFKVLPPSQLTVRAFDGQETALTTDVRHTGGSILDPSGGAYRTLARWIGNGATKNNTGKESAVLASLPCSARTPSSSHDLTVDPKEKDFAQFREDVQPMLVARCGAGNCHGSAANELELPCGTTPEHVRASYWASVDYLSAAPEESELARRPLAPAAGGAFHEGGVIFPSAEDGDYQKVVRWAKAHGPPDSAGLTDGFKFFAHRVQPVLVRKGCLQMQCHSPSIFHDYRLRGGTQGAFSLTATRKNYELSLAQVSLETDDVRASRLVRKNLFQPELGGGTGIVHRGGPLFEDFREGPATGAECEKGKYDYENGSLDGIPALCVVGEWLRRERDAMPLVPLTAIVYVARDLPGAGGLLDFGTYAPGSDLRMANVARSPSGTLTATSDRSLMNHCGLSPRTADVKRPQVAWDGSTIAFSARTGPEEPLRIYELKSDGSGCAILPEIAAHPASANGLLVHDFDPAYGPIIGGKSALVFASTRGNLDPAPYDYTGPQRTPADPARSNANLYVWEADPKIPGRRRIRQLTFLLNTERAPAFMADGRVIFAVERRLPGFSQIGLRRINLDGGDYHPLYGQRGSLGYREVSQVVHLTDKNFAAIFADRSSPAASHAGGALGIFNRSMGVDLGSTDPADYPADTSAIGPDGASAPDPSFFLHSLRIPDRATTGRIAGLTAGLYTSPAPLPDGSILASWGAVSSGSFVGDYDVYVVDSSTGRRTKLLGTEGKADIEAVAVYGRTKRDIYRSSASEPNAYAMDEARPSADVLMHDAPIILSLMMQNTPTGRVLDADLHSFDLLEDLPPPLDVKTMSEGGAFVAHDVFGSVYVRRRRVGTVPVNPDGSAHYRVTGGLPLIVELPATAMASARKLPRFLPEHVMFSPGESVHEGLPRGAFDGFCAGCHGSTSGRPFDSALQPDVLSRASGSSAFGSRPVALDGPPAQRGPIVGP